ncbi:glycoside hydrolase family 18 protein [Apiospora sp. TS-2023a]
MASSHTPTGTSQPSTSSSGTPTDSGTGPTATSVQGLNFTHSVPFFCNTTYTPTGNDTCGSIAASFSLSTHRLQLMNPNLTCSSSSSSLQNSSALCTRDGRAGCLGFTEIAAGDTCASIAARAQIGLQALSAYNPDLDCSHLASSVGIPLCISSMAPPCSPFGSSTYIVQTNDTCTSIALSNNITVDTIISLNPVADCTLVGVGAPQLCLQRDLSVQLPDQVNYQLLGLLVNAFHNNDSMLVPNYEKYLSTPSSDSASAVMSELYPMFLTSSGQQTLAGLEASNHFIAGLETTYVGKTRADYCTITSADGTSDVNSCFCGNSIRFLTCVAKMYQVISSVNGTGQVQPSRKRSAMGIGAADLFRSPVKQPPNRRGKVAKREYEYSHAFDFGTGVSLNGDVENTSSHCFGLGCCAEIPDSPVCIKVEADSCIEFAASAYDDVKSSHTYTAEKLKDLAEEIMDEETELVFGVCVDLFDDGSPIVKGLKSVGIDLELCDDILEMDIYQHRGDIEWHVTLGFILQIEFGQTIHAWNYTNLGTCEGCPSYMNPPSPNPPYQPPAGKELMAYYGNWNIWTVNGGNFQSLPSSEVSKLDSINYAFATVSYYYDPANSDTWGFYPDFTDGNSAKGRDSPCRTLLNVTSLPVIDGQPSLCGQMMYVLNDLKAINPNLKALLSIGGWYDSAYFAYATSPGKAAGSFLDSVSNFVSYFGWDGVDFDYEYPGWIHGAQVPPPIPDPSQLAWLSDAELNWTKSHAPDDLLHTQADLTNQFANFLQQLRSRLPSTRQISVAAPAGLDKIMGTQGSDFASAVCKVSGLTVNVMTYDMHGAFDNPGGMTAHQAPVLNMPWYEGPGAGYNVSAAVSHYRGACGYQNSVRLGLPFYGRIYTGVSPGATCGLGQSFVGGVVGAKGNPVLPSYDAITGSGSGYAVYHDADNYDAAYALSPAGDFVSFEDQVSIAAKLNYTIGEAGLAGAFYWLAGNDDRAELVDAVYYALQNGSSPLLTGTRCGVSSSSSSPSPSSSVLSRLSTTSSSTLRPSSTLGTSSTTKTTTTPSVSPSAQAQWGQCAGNGYTGPTQCVAPYTCVYQDEWYSQCK